MRFQYTPEISLGSLAQIITIIMSAFGVYLSLRTTDIQHEAKIEQHSVEIMDIKAAAKTERSEIKLDIKEINNNVKALDNKITEYTIQQNRRDITNAKR